MTDYSISEILSDCDRLPKKDRMFMPMADGRQGYSKQLGERSLKLRIISVTHTFGLSRSIQQGFRAVKAAPCESAGAPDSS